MGLPSFFCHNGVGDPLTTPPPAHCGIPPYQLDPKMGKFKISHNLISTQNLVYNGSHWAKIRRTFDIIQKLMLPLKWIQMTEIIRFHFSNEKT